MAPPNGCFTVDYNHSVVSAFWLDQVTQTVLQQQVLLKKKTCHACGSVHTIITVTWYGTKVHNPKYRLVEDSMRVECL